MPDLNSGCWAYARLSMRSPILEGCRAPEMNAWLDTGPFQLCVVAVAVLNPDFGENFPPLI